MIGGGEFIINTAAERVIVNQFAPFPPGVDFLVEVQEGDRPLATAARVIPERGSWIECFGHEEGTRLGAVFASINRARSQRRRFPGGALDKKYSTAEQIIHEFYTVEKREGRATTEHVLPPRRRSSTRESGEELVKGWRADR